jgi:hypothetical protein
LAQGGPSGTHDEGNQAVEGTVREDPPSDGLAAGIVADQIAGARA